MKINEIQKQLENLKSIQNYRVLSEVDSSLINLSSNDYLGLAQDTELRKKFYSKFSPTLSSSSSRLITGCSKEVMEFEKKLKKYMENLVSHLTLVLMLIHL